MDLYKRKTLYSLLTALLLFAVVAGSGCNNTFDPLMENDRYHFSMYGALDLSVDTQWVRVMPVMDSLISRSSSPIDASVSLTRLSDGHRVLLNDSLFSYREGDFYAWNYWTTETLIEGESYRLEAETSGGLSSSVEVDMPMDFIQPRVFYTEGAEAGMVYGGGVDRVVVADGVYTVIQYDESGRPLPEREVVVPHISDIKYDNQGGYRFQLGDLTAIRLELGDGGVFTIVNREVLVASGTDDWPDLFDYEKPQYVLPNIQSNVENGLGVVAGIVSKRIPMKSCYDEEGDIVPCPLIEPPY